jgi:hypothetical protein
MGFPSRRQQDSAQKGKLRHELASILDDTVARSSMAETMCRQKLRWRGCGLAPSAVAIQGRCRSPRPACLADHRQRRAPQPEKSSIGGHLLAMQLGRGSHKVWGLS